MLVLYDVMVVDWMLLGLDGLLLVWVLCVVKIIILIIFLIVVGGVEDCIEGF